MLLHLDSHDLINVFAHNNPFGPEQLERCLIERNVKLVYSPETIQEVVRPSDLLESRSRLETLVSLPKNYIHDKKEIFRREFQFATAAFRRGELNSVKVVDPFVPTWQMLHSDRDLNPEGDHKDLLVEMVMSRLETHPDHFRNLRELNDRFMANVTYDRTKGLNLRRGSAEIFRDSVGFALIQLGIDPALTVPAFVDKMAEWMLGKPMICPSWRLMGETYSEFANNVTDRGQLGDEPDFAHVSVAPYVDAITLDRRMATYCKTASGRLTSLDGDADYGERIFLNLADWLTIV